MARSQAGLILLPDGATYQDAIESSIARELAEQRQAADAAALAKAKPKGPPPHLVGSSWRRRSRRRPLQHGRLRRGPRPTPPRP